MSSELFDFGDNSKLAKSFDCSYSWSDMANALTDSGIPHDVVRELADVQVSMLFRRPVLNVFKFDDYLHDRFGDYESEGKSMKSLFDELFGEKAKRMSYYFGIINEL